MLACGGVARGRQPEGLPPVHDGEPQPRGFLRAQPGVELIQTRFGAIRPAKPDGPLPDEIADDDAVGMSLADRDFVEPNNPRAGRPGLTQLLAHVLLLQGLHGVPVEMQLLGHVPDRRGPTAPPDIEGETLGVEGIVGQKFEPFLLHRATAPTGHASHLEDEVDAQVATGEVADAALLAVVPSALHAAATPAGRFFDRPFF
jgi:hypothetical protein